jgi:hypothetical protein
MIFRMLCLATTILCWGLCLGLLIVPSIFAQVFGMTPSIEAAVMARRAAVLFVGLGGMIYAMRDIDMPHHRRMISISITAMMASLATLGLTELALGHVGVGIFVAVVPETVFAVLFSRFI